MNAPEKGINATDGSVLEFSMSDDDILNAMRQIPGYLDISMGDFRAIYHLAQHQAIDRLFAGVRAENMMYASVTPLSVEMPLDEAARMIVAQGYKGLPVADGAGRLLGMLTETDFLGLMGVNCFLELMLQIMAGSSIFGARCHEVEVGNAMTVPAISVTRSAGFREIIDAFHSHEGRSMPVTGDDGKLCGLLLRKDFLAVCSMANPSRKTKAGMC